MTTKETCPDCGAYLENWGTYQRCPWSRSRDSGYVVTDGVLRCGRPYKDAKGRTEIAAPITGRTTN